MHVIPQVLKVSESDNSFDRFECNILVLEKNSFQKSGVDISIAIRGQI